MAERHRNTAPPTFGDIVWNLLVIIAVLWLLFGCVHVTLERGSNQALLGRPSTSSLDTLMAYDLDLVELLCADLETVSTARTPDSLEVELEPGMVLRFVNDPRDDSYSYIGFGTGWHCHGLFCFSDPHGNYIEMEYGDMILGLVDGTVLVCERWRGGRLLDRQLTHSKYTDEFRFLRSGDEIRVRRLVRRA